MALFLIQDNLCCLSRSDVFYDRIFSVSLISDFHFVRFIATCIIDFQNQSRRLMIRFILVSDLKRTVFPASPELPIKSIRTIKPEMVVFIFKMIEGPGFPQGITCFYSKMPRAYRLEIQFAIPFRFMSKVFSRCIDDKG